MALIRTPRAHRKVVKAIQDFSEVNRWASDIDQRINEILITLQAIAREIALLTSPGTDVTIAAHSSQHLPTSGSDPLDTAAPTTTLGGTSSNSAGTADSFSRSDHSHDVGTAAPAWTFTTSAAEGSANTLARTDASIPIFDATAPANLANAAATGSAAFASRRDHAHRSYVVRKNSGGSDFIRGRLNLIEGTNVTLTIADDSGNDEVDVTIDAAGGGGAATHVKAITVEAPAAGDIISIFVANEAITVNSVRAFVRGSSTPSVTWQIVHGTDPTSGVALFTASKTTTVTTSVDDITATFNDDDIADGEAVWLDISAESGTTTELHLTIEYTEDV